MNYTKGVANFPGDSGTMMRNVITFLTNLTNRLRPAGSQPAANNQGTPSSGGLGQSAQGPQQCEIHASQIRPLVNGDVTTRIETVSKRGGTLSVEIAEIRVPTANGTIVDAKDIVLICWVCGQPSEEKWYCDFCSMPLCVPHVRCVALPGTPEILHLCPSCCAKFYATWDTWRGPLNPPFSIRKETRQQGPQP